MCYFNEVPPLCWRLDTFKGSGPPVGVKGVVFLYLSLQLCNYIKMCPNK